MPTWYTYELWNGHEAVGRFSTKYALCGKYLIVPTISELKREYGRSYEEIKLPIVTRLVSDNGIEFVMRRCLDVRKKSKRQMEIITRAGGA